MHPVPRGPGFSHMVSIENWVIGLHRCRSKSLFPASAGVDRDVSHSVSVRIRSAHYETQSVWSVSAHMLRRSAAIGSWYRLTLRA